MLEIGNRRKVYGIREQSRVLRGDYYSNLSLAMEQIQLKPCHATWKYDFYRVLLF